MKDFPPDTFTEFDVLKCLDMAGKKYKNGQRYILAQCPTHEDSHPSAQIFKNDWFVNCQAGCGRFHITQAYPELRPLHGSGTPRVQSSGRRQKPVIEKTYTEYDLMDVWKEMPLIPRDHYFKGIDLDELDKIGWRWDEPKHAYFIPYFNRPKTKIPFAQWRYLSGDVRFRFLKNAKPILYGSWNLEPNMPVFTVEGPSELLVLESCMIPSVAFPSASSGALMKPFAKWCMANNVEIIYAGDRDAAGDKLKEALDAVAPYRIWQCPPKYKDYGEFFEAEGANAVIIHCNKELNPMADFLLEQQNKTALELLGGTELGVVAPEIHKEQIIEAVPSLF